MPNLSRISPECEKCPFVKKCNNKRMVAEAYLMPAQAEMASPLLQPMAVKHDYRDIKVAPDTTITIDLEDLKKQIERDIYRSAGIGLNYGGDDVQRVQIKESTSNRRMFPKIIIGEYEPKYITSAEFNIYPGEVPEFKFGTVGIPDIDIMAGVKIDPSPNNLQEACQIITHELQKHGEFYDAFVESVASVLKPRERYVGDGCFCIDIDDGTDYKGLADEIVKRISGEE